MSYSPPPPHTPSPLYNTTQHLHQYTTIQAYDSPPEALPHIRPVIGDHYNASSRLFPYPYGYAGSDGDWMKAAPAPSHPHHQATTTATLLPPLKSWGHTATPLPSLGRGGNDGSGMGVSAEASSSSLYPPLSRYYVDGPVPFTSPSEHPAPSAFPSPYYDDYQHHHQQHSFLDTPFPNRLFSSSLSPAMPTHHHFTIPPPPDPPASVFHPGHTPGRSSISSNFSAVSTAVSIASPPLSSNPSPPSSHTHSPELRFADHAVPDLSPRSSPPMSVHSRSTAVVVAAAPAPPAAPTSPGREEPAGAGDDLNLIGGESASPGGGVSKEGSAAKGATSHFECPGCDLTFTRLSALKQHMLSHTGEKPHACDHCGRRFSLASNLRRHTSTKACKVLKFQTVKDTIAGSTVPSAAPPIPTSIPIMSPPPPPPVSAAPATPAMPAQSSPVAAAAAAAAASPKKDKKRKAPPSDTASGAAKPPTQRRKRHANQEARWIPRTLALFKNAHLLTSTPPFQFCMYRAPKPSVFPEEDEQEENEPFTRPTLPLNPVRPVGIPNATATSRASIRSVVTSDSASTHSSSSSSSSDDSSLNDGNTSDDGGEERDSYDVASEYPYHPASWHGRLPGPGMLGGDELAKNPSVARRWMSFKR